MNNLFLIVLEAGKSQIKEVTDLVSGEGPFLGSYLAVSHCIYSRRVLGTLWGLLYKDSNPIHEGSTRLT